MGSSKDGDECSISQESSCETNGDTNFTSSNGSWRFAFGFSGQEAKAVSLLRLPLVGLFLEKVLQKDGKDVEI